MAATALCVAATLASCGCGGKKKPEGMPKLVPCEVKITQEGAPLEGAVVSFYSDSSTWGVSGTTDAVGVAEMHTYGDFRGSPEGTFKVTVEKSVLDAGGEDLANLSPSAIPNVRAIECVDVKYKTKDSTDLTIDVKGKTKAEFEVGAPVKEEVKKL